MKTKTFLLSAIVALAVYSCSSDRDEQVQNPETQIKTDLKKIKTNNNQASETAKAGDTVIILNKLPTDPLDPTDPKDGTDPVVDPTKPDKPW